MSNLVPHLVKYGISKDSMRDALITNWNMPQEYQDACQSYYLLRWSASHVRQVWNNGVIIHKGVSYLVQYYRCYPHQIKGDVQVFVSFRQPDPIFGLQSYVLISPARGPNG